MNQERIKNLPYVITDEGKVINTNRNTEKKITFDQSGYGKVLLYNKETDSVEQYYVHQLVAEHFLPLPDDLVDPVVSFIDHDKHNLSAENLRWIDRAEMNTENHAEGIYSMNKTTVSVMDCAEGTALEFDCQATACKYVAEQLGKGFSSVWKVMCRIENSGKIYDRFGITKRRNLDSAESYATSGEKNN